MVYVTNQLLVRDPRSFDLLTVPRGAGTGFVWNERYRLTLAAPDGL